MEFHQRFYGFRCKLECDFILGDHVNMDNVSLDGDHLIVEDGFY